MKKEHFRLQASAFYILKANYQSTRADISELVDDAEFDEVFEPEVIHRAQQSLVTPKARLVEELSWLPELSDAQVEEVSAILTNNEKSWRETAIAHFPELAKANILAHLSDLQPASQTLVQELIAAWEEADPEPILNFVNRARQNSGFPAVDGHQLRSAMREVETIHSEVAAASIWRSANPGELMECVVEAELARGRTGSFLERLVRSYDRHSETDLARIGSEISDRVEQAEKADEVLSDHVSAISDLLVAWDAINQPVQVYEQHQGHEEGRSKRIYEIVRALCIDLANNHGKFTEARHLSEALLRTFPELESVAEILKDDVAQLESLDEQQRLSDLLEPLESACDALKNSRRVKINLHNDGFSSLRHGSGSLSEMVRAFERAVSALEDPSVAYLMVRDVALHFNNECNNPEIAFKLVECLISYSGPKPPGGVVGKLETDRATLHQNWKMEELNRKSGDLAAASSIIDEMLQFARGKERTEILRLKSAIDRKRRQKKIKWGIYAGIAAVIGFFILADEFDRPSSRPSYTPSTTRTTTSSSTASATSKYEEARPPVGSGHTLNRSQVRYCTFQGDRLEFIREMSLTNFQIDRFNQLISDYNSRCASFRYRSGVLSSVQREAASRSGILRADARRIVSSW